MGKVFPKVKRHAAAQNTPLMASPLPDWIYSGIHSDVKIDCFGSDNRIMKYGISQRLRSSGKGRSSRKIQQEFAHICKRYCGHRVWGRGVLLHHLRHITDDVISGISTDIPTRTASAPPPDPTGLGRSVIRPVRRRWYFTNITRSVLIGLSGNFILWHVLPTDRIICDVSRRRDGTLPIPSEP